MECNYLHHLSPFTDFFLALYTVELLAFKNRTVLAKPGIADSILGRFAGNRFVAVDFASSYPNQRPYSSKTASISRRSFP